MGFLAGKRAVIVGLASNRSIAWGIASAMQREGATLAFSYQSEKLQARVEKMAAELGSDLTLPLDVAEDAQIDAFFDGLAARWDGFDILVHSVAFAPGDQLEGRYVDAVSREGFRIAHDISSYSLAALARKSEPLMRGRAGALLTLSYLGAVRAPAELQRHGPRESEPRGERALPRSRPRPRRNSRQCDLRGPDPDARRVRRQRHSANDRARRQRGAAQTQRDDRGCRQRRSLPVLGSGRRYHRPGGLRRRGLQHRRHELPRRQSARPVRQSKRVKAPAQNVGSRTSSGIRTVARSRRSPA